MDEELGFNDNFDEFVTSGLDYASRQIDLLRELREKAQRAGSVLKIFGLDGKSTKEADILDVNYQQYVQFHTRFFHDKQLSHPDGHDTLLTKEQYN